MIEDPTEEETHTDFNFPYVDFPGVLIQEHEDRAPENFDFKRLEIGYSSDIIRMEKGSATPYIRIDQVIKMTSRAKKGIEFLKQFGRLQNQDLLPRPTRIVSVESAKKDGKIFDDVYKFYGTKKGFITPWKIAPGKLNNPDCVNFEDARRSKARDLNGYYSRFVNALAYVNPKSFLSQDNYLITDNGSICLPIDKFLSLREHSILLTLDHLKKMTSIQYRRRFLQKPPKNAFEELINAYWRKLAYQLEHPAR